MEGTWILNENYPNFIDTVDGINDLKQVRQFVNSEIMYTGFFDSWKNILHIFKKSVSLEESLKRMKKNKKMKKVRVCLILIDFGGRSPGQIR